MTNFVRRKRGRPRLDEPPDVNDFDVNLIREFHKRRALYDRNHPQNRNREYLEPLWTDIANTLGISVSFVKSRMLQLRNRYNLERRRVESLQEQYSNSNITSQWALFKHLDFLGDHIKTRRPFLSRVSQSGAPVQSGSNSSDEQEYNRDNPEIYIQPEVNRSLHSTNNSVCNGQDINFQEALPDHLLNFSMDCNTHVPNVSCSSDKYKAFGQFLVSSLNELSEVEALKLVEKMTKEIVQSLLAEQMQNPTQTDDS